MKTKTCAKCATPKPISEFYVDRYRVRDGRPMYRTACKPCVIRSSGESSRKNAEQTRRTKRRHLYRIRREALIHYSGERLECKCCGESHEEFLTIDHVNNDGASHRREMKIVGTGIYTWLKRNNFPDGFQVLCMNCNCARAWYGACPHEAERLGVPTGSEERDQLVASTDRPRGVKHPRAKFTDEQVVEIRKRYQAGSVTTRELATEYGVSRGAIEGALSGRRWSHLPGAVPAEVIKEHRRMRNRGSANGKAKLTDEQVAEMRRVYETGEMSQPELAKRFGVHQATVWRVVKGKRH